MTASGVFRRCRPWHVWLTAGLLASGLRLALLPLLPIPAPLHHDEFSYLLGADTFSSGRITNPPHPLWVHFETFHVNMLPTYCSKYPPGQAVFLAIGQTLFGHPWYGVCLSMGFMFGAICWMLQGWVVPKYAALTTLFGILAWGVTSEWANSYWGGAVAAAGGALVIGAIPRIVRQAGAAPVLPGAIGLVILANSRPFEGLLTAVAAAGVLLWQLRSRGKGIRTLLMARTIAPFLLVMIPAAVGMGYYNYRTTGNALELPYSVNQKTYTASPFFWIFAPAPARPPVYRHENLRNYWVGWVLPDYEEARSRPGRAIWGSTLIMGHFYLLSPFTLAVAVGVVAGWSLGIGAALAIAAAPAIGLTFASSALPHYLAPVFGTLLIVGAAGLQKMGQWKAGGTVLVAGFAGVALGWCAIGVRIEADWAREAPKGITTRPLLLQRLHREGGQHLVIVRYSATHNVHEEWVYNRANIDAAQIVWAQDMGEEKNRELVNYFRGRKVWLLQPDIDPLSLAAYP